MIDWLASFGAGLIRVVTLFAMLFGSIWCTIKLGEHAPRQFARLGHRTRMMIGFCVWFALFAALSLLLGPALTALEQFGCKDARDYDLCLNAPDPEYF